MKNNLTREELYNLIWSRTMTNLAEEFETTIHQLKKVCKEFNIPIPPQGYWARKRHNKKVAKPKLTKDFKGEETVDIPKKIPNEDLLSEYADAFKKEDGLDFRVPKRLTNPHKLIREAMDAFKGRSSWDGLIKSHRNELDVNVSASSQSRAFRFMNALIRLLENRGHKVFNKYDETQVVIEEEEVAIRLLEIRKKVPTGESYPQYRYKATGVFKFQYGKSWRRKEIKEGRVAMESLLAKILISLEAHGHKEHEERLEREIYWKEQEEKRLIELEIKRKEAEEQKRWEVLVNRANEWKQVQIVKEYLESIETKNPEAAEWIKEQRLRMKRKRNLLDEV